MIQRLRHTPYLAAAASGVLMGLAFPPSPLGFLAWFGFAPLLIRVSGALPWRTVVAESIASMLMMVATAGYWVAMHPITSTRYASVAGLVVFAVTAAVPFWSFGLPTEEASSAKHFGLFFALSAIIEYAQFHTEIGFPWFVPGHTQATVFPINQLAAYAGAAGLSTWVLITNTLVVVAVLSRKRTFTIGASSVLGAFILGSIVLGYHHAGRDRTAVHNFDVVAVQPALSPESWSNIYDVARPDTMMDLTRRAGGVSPDLVIWPETALPVLQPRDRPSAAYLRLKSFIDSLDAPILTGAVIKVTAPHTGVEAYRNSAVLLSPYIGITGRYDKRILVPFAERVPYVDRYPWLRRLSVSSGGVMDYGRGASAGKLSLGAADIGVMICFESVFSRAALEPDPENVAFYVVLAQDGWWGDTPGYRQHWALTRLRAIETGRAVVQATVTGITGLALPDGKTEGETTWMAQTTRRLSVPEFTGSTPYAALGDLPTLGFSLLILLSGWVIQIRVSE